VTFFEHGFQSWSYCKTRTFLEEYEHIDVELLARMHQNKDNLISGRYISESVTAISDTTSKGTIVLGFCTLADNYSRIVMDHFSSPSQISWLSTYSQFDNTPLNQLIKRPICSEELFITFKTLGQGYHGLITYAEVTGKKMKARVRKPLVGWCSWYYYYTQISDATLLSNVRFFEQAPDIPIDLIQLDDGYFTEIGDYTSFNEKFPNGITEFVQIVRKQNKIPGIWIAPFFASENSNLYQNHPKWFILSRDDHELFPICYNWGQFEYGLDLTQTNVQHHIDHLIDTIINQWNMEFIKIDFIYAASVFESNYFNKGLTRAQIYREGVKLIRNAMGDQTYLLGCGAPLGPSVGLVDAMRVSEDTKELWDFGNEPVYGDHCLKYALIGSIYRSFMHLNFWINDPDCLIVRKADSELNDNEIKLQITVFGLSGGQLFISDDMTKLEADRLDLALKLIPPYYESAIPIDALYEPLPTLYLLETQTRFGIRALLSVINWTDEVISRKLYLKDILTKTLVSDRYLVFDWWDKKLLGSFHPSRTILQIEIPPHGCRYFGIVPYGSQENKKSPIILSSTLHISQGCLEIKQLKDDSNSLEITLSLPGYHTGDLFIFCLNNMNLTIKRDIEIHQKLVFGSVYRLPVELKETKKIKIKYEFE
jgi:alpha-galactosidase